MNRYTNGVILKRKFEDFSEVKIVGVSGDFTMVQDSCGRHFVQTKKLPEYFDIVEPETIINKVYEHQNIDNPLKHNVSGSMNKPSSMQEEAFKKIHGE